jgi:hypothetical protein
MNCNHLWTDSDIKDLTDEQKFGLICRLEVNLKTLKLNYYNTKEELEEIGYCGCDFCIANKKEGKKYDMHVTELK